MVTTPFGKTKRKQSRNRIVYSVSSKAEIIKFFKTKKSDVKANFEKLPKRYKFDLTESKLPPTRPQIYMGIFQKSLDQCMW